MSREEVITSVSIMGNPPLLNVEMKPLTIQLQPFEINTACRWVIQLLLTWLEYGARMRLGYPHTPIHHPILIE
ncbi:hypothetical protein D3C87_1996330 [compost metagenome]